MHGFVRIRAILEKNSKSSKIIFKISLLLLLLFFFFWGGGYWKFGILRGAMIFYFILGGTAEKSWNPENSLHPPLKEWGEFSQIPVVLRRGRLTDVGWWQMQKNVVYKFIKFQFLSVPVWFLGLEVLSMISMTVSKSENIKDLPS